MISQQAAELSLKNLLPHAGQKIQLIWFVTSPETANFAGQIYTLLLESGWMVFLAPVERTSRIPQGVCFSNMAPSAVRTSAAAVALEVALRPLTPVTRCAQLGGLLPFATFRDKSERAIEAKNVKAEEIMTCGSD
jgi:hypothetical protein